MLVLQIKMLSFNNYRKIIKQFNISATRQVRSVAKREKQFPKLLKGSIVTLDNDVGGGGDFSPVNSYEDLNKKLKKMFVEPNDFKSKVEVNEGGHSDEIPNIERLYYMQKSKEEEQRRLVKRQIIKRTFFKEPPETSLLTYAAKTQMRYLHRLNSEEWTAEKLAESFPASVASIKRIIRWNPPLPNDEKVKVDDEIVAKRWEALKSNGDLSDFSPVTLKLWKEGKLLQDFYAGNRSLPQPPKTQIQNKFKRIGEHGAIVKKYVDYKKEKEQKSLQKATNSSGLKPGNIPQNESVITKHEGQLLRNLTMKHATPSEMEDTESASYLAMGEVDSKEPDVLPSQFEQNMMEEFSEKKHKTSVDQAYMEWMEKKKLAESSEKETTEIQPYDVKNFACTVKKFNFDNTIELSHDKTANKSNVAYLYDSDKGYQHPYGKEIVRERIKIPRRLYKKGATYKVGLCFYNEQGHFLYKLPAEISDYV